MIEDIYNKINWLGHGSFRINGDQTIYIDPFQLSSDVKADIILITHEHFDHCSPDDIARIQTSDTIIVTEKGSAEKVSGDVRRVAPGESVSINGIGIEAVPAYNLEKEFHPKENGWLGFILEIDGVRIYHTGDTDHIPEMDAFETDIALIPVSGTYVMDVDEAVAATLAIKPKIAVPMHYGAIVGSEEDAVAFQTALAGQFDVRLMEKQ